MKISYSIFFPNYKPKVFRILMITDDEKITCRLISSSRFEQNGHVFRFSVPIVPRGCFWDRFRLSSRKNNEN